MSFCYSNEPPVLNSLAAVSPLLFKDFRRLAFDRDERPFTDTMLQVRNALKAIYGDEGFELYLDWLKSDAGVLDEVGGKAGVRRSWERTSGPTYDEVEAAEQIGKLAAASTDQNDFASNPARRAREEAELQRSIDDQAANPERLAIFADDFETSPRRQLLEFAGDVTEAGMAERDASALVRKLLYPRDTVMIYGKSGAGKSFVALDLAWHLALGRDWHGRKVKQAPVLYVTLEGVQGFRKRMRAYTKRFSDPDGMFARLAVPVSLDQSKTGENGVRMIIDAAAGLKELTGQPVGLIVIDTLARAISGADENAADAAMHYLQKRVEIITRVTGAATLTVHHENKLGGIRGSSAIIAGMDLVLHATGTHLNIEKAKDDDQGTLFRYDLEPVEIAAGDAEGPVTSCVLRTQPAAKQQSRKTKPAATPSKAQMTLSAAWMEIQSAGKSALGSLPSTGEPASSCNMALIHDAFISRYPTADTDGDKARETRRKAWARLIGMLPTGFAVEVDASGNNVFWRIEDPFPGLE